jgi:hypothetical protein
MVVSITVVAGDTKSIEEVEDDVDASAGKDAPKEVAVDKIVAASIMLDHKLCISFFSCCVCLLLGELSLCCGRNNGEFQLLLVGALVVPSSVVFFDSSFCPWIDDKGTKDCLWARLVFVATSATGKASTTERSIRHHNTAKTIIQNDTP